MKKILVFIIGLCSISSYAKWNPKSSDTYATHQPVLVAIATMTSGPIIEFGCGNGSTDILHDICKKDKRILISIDDNLEWLNKFRNKYKGDGYTEDNSGWHKFFFVPGNIDDSNPAHWIEFLNTCELLTTIDFDLCFIDQSPWEARTATIMHMKDKVKYIILHDCDYFASGVLGTTVQPMDSKKNIPGVYDFSKTFASFKVYFPPKPWPGHSGPPTLLGSNFEANLPDVDFVNY